MAGAIRRVPAIADAPVDADDQRAQRASRPTTSSSSARSDVRGLFVAAGFCAHGIAGAGGIGRQVASWIVDGEPELDLWKMDIRRFGAQYRSRSYTLARSYENYATYYDIHYPNEERQAGRPLRVSPAYARLATLGASVRGEVGRGSARTGSSRMRVEPAWLTPRARGAPAARLGGRALEPGDRGGGARHADDGDAVRRDVVREDRARRAGCREAAAVVVRQRRRPRGRQHHVHPAAATAAAASSAISRSRG